MLLQKLDSPLALRHRQGHDRRLQPPLPAVPHRIGPRQAPLRDRRLARPAARPARTHRVLRPARARVLQPAGARVQGGRAADGGLAAGQAAVHRHAGGPPPARAGRDLLQLGDDQDPAPQLFPERLHLRAPGHQHRVHRERRARRKAPPTAPTTRDATPSSTTCGAWCATSRCTWSSRISTATRCACTRRCQGLFDHVHLRANFQIQVLSSLFYRNKGAYVVGKMINGFQEVPFACRSCIQPLASS